MLEENKINKKYNIAFFQGRPSAHHMHMKFAQSIGSRFYFIDFKMRWQDKSKSIFYRMTSWILCGLTFPEIKKFDFFYIDNLHFMPVIMKIFRLRKDQKIVAHLGSHTLYFIYAHRFSWLTEKLHVWALSKYDALICEGLMAEDLVKKILPKNAPPLYTIINGIPEEHFPRAEDISKLDSNTILFAGHGPGKDRMWYKGLDLMLKAFEKAKKIKPNLQFVIVGEWHDEVKRELLSGLELSVADSVKFVGKIADMKGYFSKAALYLHCARGEAYGLTILIAMSYGLPVIVSDWTGAKEVVSLADDSYVIELNENKIGEKIIEYFNLPIEKRHAIGLKNQEIGATYTESRAITDFENKFAKMINDFKVK